MTDKTWEVLPKEEPPRSGSPRLTFGGSNPLAAAFVVAVISDVLSVWLEFVPPMQWALDLGTALLLFLLLGRQWMILPALIAEAIPGAAVFPAWVMVVVSVAIWGTVSPIGRQPPPQG